MTKLPIILVADDEEPILKLLRVNLTKAGYNVISACNGTSALQLVEEYKPDLVILDIMMPGKSGVELLMELRTRFPDTAVIMATALSDTTTAINCMKNGADDYLTKPFDIRDIILAVHRVMEKRSLNLKKRKYQKDRVEAQDEKIRASFQSSLTALSLALEAKDGYTNGHSQRVADISELIAAELGMSQDSIREIIFAGLIHDVGKIGVSENILNKPGKLTAEEFDEVKCHCAIGEHILSPIMGSEEIMKIVRHHHERYDGTGYPDGLSDGQIPIGARILAVADSYDAMTSKRPYRGAMSAEAAFSELESGRRTQFDPSVVDAFLKVKGPLLANIGI
jgi:putative two-component system response regulator